MLFLFVMLILIIMLPFFDQRIKGIFGIMLLLHTAQHFFRPQLSHLTLENIFPFTHTIYSGGKDHGLIHHLLILSHTTDAVLNTFYSGVPRPLRVVLN